MRMIVRSESSIFHEPLSHVNHFWGYWDASFHKAFARAKQMPTPFFWIAIKETFPYKEPASCIIALNLNMS